MAKFSPKLIWKALKQSFKGFSQDKVTKLSASLAYYTVFSLAPMLLVLIYIAGFFFGQEAMQGTITKQIETFIGYESAAQVQEMIKNASISGGGPIAMIVGIVALLIGATSMFAELQDSINMIWGIKPKPNVGIMKTIKNRLLSFGIIGSLVFLLLVSLVATALITAMGQALENFFPQVTVVILEVVNWVFTLAITSVLFAVIFKVLPDVKIGWKDVFPGAIATSILFLIGKFLISFYIGKSDIGGTYGAAGSLVVLLVWIYYSSIILYFGAEFTKFYAFDKGARVVPNHYAQWEEGHKPGIFGSEKKELSPLGRTPEKFTRKELIPAYAPRVASTPRPAKKKNTGPGIGTVLFGLAIYFFKNGKR